jgi:hypothetical protein
MKACESCVRRPTGAALQAGAREGARSGSPGGRRLDLAKAGSIDVQPVAPRSAKEQGVHALRFNRPKRRQRARPAKREAAEKAAALPRAARKRRRDSQSARSRRRAVKHGAVGGRMTARWSGVFRGATAATPRLRGGSRCGTPPGFPGSARRAVSEEGVFAMGAREQTSVVETDSKHPGGASKESREALRGANRQATGRRTARTGPAVILFAEGCNGSRRPQGPCEPSVGASCKPLVASIEPRRPVPRLSIGSVEGARGLDAGER